MDFPNRPPAEEPTSMVDQLRRKNVDVLKVEDEGYARFAWVRDGNRIELYQPTPPPPAS